MGADGQARLVESIATRRLGTPADIVHGVLFFASDHADALTDHGHSQKWTLYDVVTRVIDTNVCTAAVLSSSGT